MMDILVVDDEPAVCTVVRLVLSREGHAVTSCDHGEAALDLLAEREPAVALIDLSLPKVRGLTIVEAARALRPQLPIIVITGMLSEGLKSRFECSDLVKVPGVYGLGKPFKPKDLCRLVAIATSPRRPDLDDQPMVAADAFVAADSGPLRDCG
jgi:CheY-like chemotaxis protein